MHALIVIAHPEQNSFNGYLKNTAVAELEGLGYKVEVSDLYAMDFDPVEGKRHFDTRLYPDRFDVQAEQRHAYEESTTNPTIQEEIDKLNRADLVILQFPIWWFAAPAILKGWLDRVLVYGLYTGRKRFDEGVFQGKRAFLSVTAGGPESSFLHDGRNGDIDLLLWPLNYTLHYMGFTVLPQIAAFDIGPKDTSERQQYESHANQLRRKIQTFDVEQPLKFNVWEDWGEDGRLKPHAPWYNYFTRPEK